MTCCISHIKHFIFPLGIAQVTYVEHIVLNMCNMYDTKAHLSKYIFSCSGGQAIHGLKRKSLTVMHTILFIGLREHAPRLPSLTCLAHTVEHHMKEIISDLHI